MLVIRSLLASGVVQGTLMIVVRVISFLWQYLVSLPAYRIKVTYQALVEAIRKRRERRQAEKLKQAAQQVPVISREDRLRQVTDQARRDYELDCELIRSAGLDKDEQQAALVDAKRRFLGRLKEVLQ